MALDPSVFEKLGAFYLGRPVDPATRQPVDAPLLYDSRDLTTHAVCVGMTGSGKTGLCLALLEEAAIDGIPAILIDPKGDLGNLLLTFPELRPEDFRPWIQEEEARRKGQSPEEYAAAQAQLWKNGLAQWGEGPERIRSLREKVDLAIYTPGSTSGRAVDVLGSFEPPASDDPEVLAERAQTTVAGLLGLLKLNADPLNSRESILLTGLLVQAWQEGRSLDLATLITQIQSPPFQKLGVIDLETFYPAKDRFTLVLALNNLLASPRFAAWRQGDPLEVGNFLYTPEGKPRLAIFSIAHLDDEERMFFVTLLLNEFLAWTRAQSGTSSLRAILYMDEIFGYLPPSANPPSKRPLLTLLKQARAFGVGVVVATQNPVDLDYKALSNTGTWFIGRLQTERDRARLLDGLQSAGGGFDRSTIESLLAGLGQRVFLMNNVHDDGPVLFETRWTLSYLRGPLTREQIKTLMVEKNAAAPPPAAEEPTDPAPATAQRPALPPGVPQVFVPAGARDTSYAPRLLGLAIVVFRDAKAGLDETREIALAAPLDDGSAIVDWDAAEELDLRPADLEKQPRARLTFEELPAALAVAKNYAGWEKDFAQWLAAHEKLEVFRCVEFKEVSRPAETRAEFAARLALRAREQRDAEVDRLRAKYATRQETLRNREARAAAAVAREKEQASHARLQTMISVGSTILGAFLGRRAVSAGTLNKAATAARGVGRSMKEGADVAASEQSLEAIRAQIAELEEEFARESAALRAREPVIEAQEIRPARSGVKVSVLALGWTPR